MWPVLQSLEHITSLQRMALNRHRRGTTSRLKLDANKESARSHFKFMIIIKPQGIPYENIVNQLVTQLLITKHH